MSWDPHHLPDQSGRTHVVTGGAGIGYFIAEQLAGAGAHVIIAARNPVKAVAAEEALRGVHPGATVSSAELDLASLASIRTFPERIGGIDGIVLNAAVMVTGQGDVTADGFDPIMGTGHLGNAALVAAVLPSLSPGGRIVGTTSGFARRFHPDVPDLATVSMPLPRANASTSVIRYTLSKGVHEAFFAELDRRLRADDIPVSALLSHPGIGVDSRSPDRPGLLKGPRSREPLLGLIGAGKDAAAQSAVRALTDPGATGGQYWGPSGATKGMPTLGSGHPKYRDPALGARVWAQTEELVGVRVVA